MKSAIQVSLSVLAIVFFGGCSERAAAQDQLRSEGEQIGMVSSVIGACSGAGYVIDEAMQERRLQEWWNRAQAAGWTEAEAREVYRSGLASEDARLGTFDARTDLPNDEFMRRFSGFLTKLKPRCHEVANTYPSLITDLAAGDRQIDGDLAKAERNSAP